MTVILHKKIFEIWEKHYETQIIKENKIKMENEEYGGSFN